MLRLTRAQVREVDRRAIEDLHIPGIVLMENAACSASDAAREMLRGDCIGQVLILCGGGNNGGDGLAVARHLHNCGASVQIALTIDPSHYKGDALLNWRIAEAIKLPVVSATPDLIQNTDALLIIDAIFGTGLTDAPRPPFDQIAASVNDCGRLVLAIDIPSGLDCDTGIPPGPCIRATRTITFVAEKVGFAHSEARTYTGDILVGDIGVPPELVEQIAGQQQPAAAPA